jgi:hypothetical protein
MSSSSAPVDANDPLPGFLHNAKAKWREPSLPSVLCINRVQFASDLHAIAGAGYKSRYNWLEIAAHDMTALQREWVPEHLQTQRYEQAQESEDVWARSAAFAEELLRRLRDEVRLVAVMSANFDYWVDEGLRRACRTLGIPFLVMMREVCLERKFFDDFYSKYSFQPDVAGVAVAGELTKDVFVKWGVLPADIVVTTGLPRFDWWLNPPPPPERPRDSIILFTFADPEYFGEETFYDVFCEFVAASNRHKGGDVDFILKCKHPDDLADMENLQQAVFPKHNILYSLETRPPRLLTNARGVIGYNSLVLVETLLSQVPIYDPCWGDAAQANQLFFPDDPLASGQVSFLRSPAELAAALDKMATTKPDSSFCDRDRRLALVQRYVDFRWDKSSAERVDAFVDRFVG